MSNAEAKLNASPSPEDRLIDCMERNARLVAALEAIMTGVERLDDDKRDSDYGQGILKGLNSAADIARTALQLSLATSR